MPLALPLVAIGVAFLMLLVAYAATVLITPILEAVLRRIPLIGGRLATWAAEGVQYAYNRISGWVTVHIRTMVGWLSTFTDTIIGHAQALTALADATLAAFEHLVTVTLPREIRAGIRDVKDTADRAYTTAHNAAVDISNLDDAVTTRIHDARRAVERELSDGIDTVERDLRAEIDRKIARGIGDLRNDVLGRLQGLEGEISGAEADIRGEVATRLRGIEAEIGTDVATVEGDIERLGIPGIAQKIAELAGAAAIVDVIVNEAGLGRAECRAKVKGICSTDPSQWDNMLAGLLALDFGIGLRELIEAGNAIVSTVGSELADVG